MPPQLIPCSFCDRLYTHFSIDLHQPQCLSNPNRRVKLPQIKRAAYSSIGPTNNSTRHLPAMAERRSRSVGSNSMSGSNSSTNSNSSPQNNDENRPSTRSINHQNRLPKSRSKNRLNAPKRKKTPKRQESLTDSDMRICFVCGEKVKSEELIDHEIECEAEWRTMRRDFPNTIRARSPRAMKIPSVDGSVDNSRLDMYASESADRAQRTRCLRCCRHVPFSNVPQHQCTRFEPTVQFYF